MSSIVVACVLLCVLELAVTSWRSGDAWLRWVFCGLPFLVLLMLIFG